MPKYYEEKEEEKHPCGGVKEDLKSCLLQSDCVMQEGKSPKECLKEGYCKALQVTFLSAKDQLAGLEMPRLYKRASSYKTNVSLTIYRQHDLTTEQDSEEERDTDEWKLSLLSLGFIKIYL